MGFKFFAKFLVLLSFVSLFFHFSTINIQAQNSLEPLKENKEIKQPIKDENQNTKSVRCNNCPNACLIQPSQTGICGQYKNIGGKLVPVK